MSTRSQPPMHMGLKLNTSLCVSQGGWETDEEVEAAAARETVEEAGVRGRLEVRE